MQTRDGRNVFCRRLPGQTQDKKREDDEKEQEYRKDTKKTSSFDRCICPRRIKEQRIFPWHLFLRNRCQFNLSESCALVDVIRVKDRIFS